MSEPDAEVAHQLRPDRTGEDAAEVENAYARERSGIGGHAVFSRLSQ